MAAERRAAPEFTCERLQSFAGTRVRVRLRDGTQWVGRLRTELLSDRSLSVYLAVNDGEGATLYLDQIAEIVPNDSADAG